MACPLLQRTAIKSIKHRQHTQVAVVVDQQNLVNKVRRRPVNHAVDSPQQN